MMSIREKIEALSISQKLTLLATGKIEGNVGLLDIKYLEDINSAAQTVYPSFYSMANTWDCELVSRIASELTFRANKNQSAIITPNLSLKTNPYKAGMSEDPYLSGKIAASYSKGISNAGAMPVLANCSVSLDDTLYMDTKPNNSVIFDYVAKPFEMALSEGGGAVAVSCLPLNGIDEGYRDVNLGLKFLNTHTISQHTDSEWASVGLHAGNTFLLDGNVKALDAAYRNGLRLERELSEGKISRHDFDTACNNGTALKEAVINVWVDRFVSFVEECKSHSENIASDIQSISPAALSRRASSESIVLLKNAQRLLPLKAETRVAVIAAAGQSAAAQLGDLIKTETKLQYVGFREGYTHERNDRLIEGAVALANDADVIVIYFNIDKSNKKCAKIPANQLALLDAIKKCGKQIIVLINADYAVDTSFDEDCDALIVVPNGGTHTTESVAKVLCGKINPSGKLSYSLIDGTDEHYGALVHNKNINKIKIGAFFGYRRLDAEGERVRYPFGHGLGFSRFTYSGLRVVPLSDKLKIEFRLKNSGLYAGTETAQVYIGKKDSNIVRPIKELKAFNKVSLEAGQNRVISLNVMYNELAVYDKSMDERKIEDGEYMIYVGASAGDIRLTKVCDISGDTISQSEDNLSDYIERKSNILDGKYMLTKERNDTLHKKIRLTALLAIIAISLFDFAVPVFGLFDKWAIIMLAILNLIVIPAAIVYLVVDSKKRKQNTIPQNEVELENELPLEKLFVEQFGKKKDAPIEEAEQDEDNPVTLTKKGLTMLAVVNQFATFMNERGIQMPHNLARAFISSIFASRMLLMRSDNAVLLEDFERKVAEFFGGEIFADTAPAEGIGSTDRLLFAKVRGGGARQTAIASGIDCSLREKERMHFASLRGVDVADKALVPIAAYASNPDEGKRLMLNDKSLSDKEFVIPPNLWFLISLSNTTLLNLPSYITENAILVDLKLKKLLERGEKTPMRPLTFGRFLQLEQEQEQYAVKETTYKKIDKLEAFVKGKGEYRITNKEWRGLERLSSAYLAADASEADAIDQAIASKLLMRMVSVAELLSGEESLISALERILGEENITISTGLLKRGI